MQRRLTTIMVADLVAYSRLMADDEDSVIAGLHRLRADLVDPAIAAAGGRVIKSMGDGLLAEFASPVAAVRCAAGVQAAMAAAPPLSGGERLRYRIGLHLGDIVPDGDDILGDGVNIAARLEALAPPGGICLSRAIHDQVAGKIGAGLVALGPQRVKNLPHPIEVWRLEPAAASAAPAPAGTAAPPSVAVLPFSEIGPAGDDFLADGIVEEITSALSCVREFMVIARQSAFAFRGGDTDVRDVGRRLGARYVVTGSVRRSGDRLRVAVQLADAATGVQILSERHDDHIDDLFDLQDRIASHVAGAMSPSIRAAEIASARSLPPADRGAYALYMSAYPHFWAHRRTENERAIGLLGQSLDQNPAEVRARAVRAWAYAQQATYMWTLTPLVSRAAAIADAEAAVQSVADHAPSLVAIGAAFSMTTTDPRRPRALLDRALSLDPNSAWGWMRSGWLRNFTGEIDLALAEFDRAEALSPRDPFLFNIQFGRGFAHGLAGDYDIAIRWFEDGLAAGSGAAWAYRDLASFHARAGHKADADIALHKLLEHYPDLTIRRVIDSMPPAVAVRHATFIDGLRRAGVPDA